jgi:exonuclease III
LPKQPLRNEGDTAYPKLKGFKIGHLNIASLPKHIEELKILLKEMPFDILCINETRLNDLIDTNTVSIPGYGILRRDRNRYGGGVAIYIRDNLVYVNRNDLIPENLEAICIEIKNPRTKPFLLSSWYRAPDLNVEIFDYFEIFLRKAEQENKDIIITGDLN